MHCIHCEVCLYLPTSTENSPAGKVCTLPVLSLCSIVSLKHITDNFHIAMTVGIKPCTLSNLVIVYYAQCRKTPCVLDRSSDQMKTYVCFVTTPKLALPRSLAFLIVIMTNSSETRWHYASFFTNTSSAETLPAPDIARENSRR